MLNQILQGHLILWRRCDNINN